MYYSKLLQHCRDEHGVNIDASDLAGSLRKSIWHYFNKVHNLTLHDTELWDILECLQERPKPGNPPPIVALMKQRTFENIKCGEEMESASWYAQSGVLISNRDALAIVEFCERVNAPEQLPDYGTGFRPDWSQIAPKYVSCTVDKNGEIYLHRENPRLLPTVWVSDGIPVRFPYYIKGPVENWKECIWQRPGHGEKEGAE